MTTAPRSLLEVVRLSTSFLERHGSGSARLDAELLTAHALQLRRIDLYLQHDRPLSDTELNDVRELVRRRGRGEPVAHLTGTREFYGRPFTVTSDVLVPRPETETLVERALEHIRGRAPIRVADLGTGTGCIAITLALDTSGADLDATDISPAALQVAAANAQRHGVGARVRLHQGSWADPLQGDVDVLVANPPYVTTGELIDAPPDVRDFEPHTALDGGGDGLVAYRELLVSAQPHVRAGSVILLEVDPRRAAAVAALVATQFLTSTATTYRDLAGNERVIEAVLR